MRGVSYYQRLIVIYSDYPVRAAMRARSTCHIICLCLRRQRAKHYWIPIDTTLTKSKKHVIFLQFISNKPVGVCLTFLDKSRKSEPQSAGYMVRKWLLLKHLTTSSTVSEAARSCVIVVNEEQLQNAAYRITIVIFYNYSYKVLFLYFI